MKHDVQFAADAVSFSGGSGEPIGSAGQEEDPERVMEPFAIIGFSARYAQEASNPEKFWEFLLRARQATTPVPKDRFNSDAFYHPDPEHGGTFPVKGAHFLAEDPLAFDAGFFNINKTEVLSLDPQQRVVMENVYHALENAGIPMERAVSSKTSVFAGGFNHDHMNLLNTDTETALKHIPTGSQNAIISNRVSWFYDFHGPSAMIDTGCSSGLVAAHFAAQSLQSGDCEMAVVTAGSVITHIADIISFGHAGFLGPTGKCFTFDHRAEGYARGEGVGTIILKSLSSATRDGNTIRAVVRGTGVNQDGRTPGITLPSATAQEALIREIYKNASLDPKDTMFVEAHGTGTEAGDPIEASAISSAFASEHRKRPLYVGALKASIGHLEGGAGIAGIIKSILMLESGIIPPNVNFEKVNPNIPKEEWNIDFPTECMPWPESGTRRISVNSFGFGGTNAHCILDDAYSFFKEKGLLGYHNTRELVPTTGEIHRLVAAPGISNGEKNYTNGDKPHTNGDKPYTNGNGTYTNGDKPFFNGNGAYTNGNGTYSNGLEPKSGSANTRVFVLSAFDKESLQRIASDLGQYITQKRPLTLAAEEELLDDIAFTFSERRSKFRHRSYVLASSIPELEESLSSDRSLSNPVSARQSPRIGFVFTGQGAQYHGMGKQLLVYPVFRRSLEEATAYLKTLGSTFSLIDALVGEDSSLVHTPAIAHPGSTAIQVALVDLLSSWNIHPTSVVGHSSGEIAAAYCAGKISREAAWKAAYYRGYVCSKPKSVKGSMIAVGLDQEKLQPYMDKVHAKHDGELVIACLNGPRNNTVSGDEAMIDALKELLDAEDIFARKLKVQDAYHSAHMRTVSDEYLQLMGTLPTGKLPRSNNGIRMFSTVSGDMMEEPSLDASYWVDNMVSPVRFTDGLRSMLLQPTENDGKVRQSDKSSIDAIIEVGSHSALESATKETIGATVSGSSVSYMSLLKRHCASTQTILNTVGSLSSKTSPVDLYEVNHNFEGRGREPRLLVDLPPYAFNHEEKGYYQSRLSKNLRFREFPRHQLFGAPVQDWNRQNRKWRHFLRCAENPWLREHVVTENNIFPAAGFLTMAIEAVRQVTGDVVELTGLRLKDVSIKTALVVPDTKEGVEVSLSLLPVNESSLWQSTVWKWFQICSYAPDYDDWVEHCSGYISIEYTNPPDPVENGRETEAAAKAWKDEMGQGVRACQKPMDIEKVYENFETVGLKYGDLFRNFFDIMVSGERKGLIMGGSTTPDLTSAMPKNYVHSHLIHPTTLDSMFVAGLVAICDHGGQNVLRRPMVPTYIKEAWLSSEISSEAGTNFNSYGKAAIQAYDAYDFNLKCSDKSTGEARVSLSGVRFTPLSAEDASLNDTQQTGYAMDWTPDINMLETPQFRDLVSDESPGSDEPERNLFEQLQLASTLLVTDALRELKDAPASSFEGHFQKYHEWMKHVTADIMTDLVPHVSFETWRKYSEDQMLKEELYRTVASSTDMDGELLVRLGSNIAGVLRNELDPLYLMFGEGDMMSRYYEHLTGHGDSAKNLDSYLSLMGDNTDGLEILEVGAGTGAFTKLLLNALAPRSADTENAGSACKVSEFTFTDLSPSFFSKAKEKLEQWEDILTFKKLDIGSDPTNQGFTAEKYDVILANNVFHATEDLEETLTNARRLLKPGGKVLIQEVTRPDIVWPLLIFGLLPGWWLSVEPIRRWCPLITITQWDDILRRSGFSGVDLEIPNSRFPEFAKLSSMISTAVEEPPKNGDEVLILCEDSDAEDDIISTLKSKLTQTPGVSSCALVRPCELKGRNITKTICISLLELEKPVLSTISETDFYHIRDFLSVCKNLLWVTGNTKAEPKFNMSTGTIRTIRWERAAESPNLVTLATTDSGSPKLLIDGILKVFRFHFTSGQTEHKNAEYLVRNGLAYTQRVYNHSKATSFLRSQFTTQTPEMAPLESVGRPVKLQNTAPGLFNKLQWVTDTTYAVPLGDTDVEVDIRAVGLNFVDLLMVMGEVPGDVIGREAAGIVTRAGSSVEHLQPGDRVVYLSDSPQKGTFQTHGRANQSLVTKLPDDMSFEVAAGLPVIYATVIYSLKNVGRLAAGETILIHSAAGGVGQAAIQYAKAIGAEIFATVSSSEKMEFLMEEYGIPEDHIFSSRATTFVQGIMRMTDNTGVDVVLNSLSREALRQSWECVAPFGRFIEIGKKDLQAGGKLDMTPFLRNITFTGVDLLSLAENKPRVIQELLRETMELWTEKKIKGAHPTTVLGYSELESGLRMLQAGKQMGKIVFAPKENELVPVIPEARTPYRFEPSATYVLAGGLGGLGRSIAKWMVSRGAKHLVFLSRTGKVTPPVQEMVSSIELKGCESRIFACDVSDIDSLQSVFEECKRTLPPIRGCIQCSMVLKDGAFENMTYTDWNAVTNPKVHGSLNLHSAFPGDLDFFILLSSVGGIMGSRSQANYSAGNTYQDALAKHRTSKGLRAASLDLGPVLSVGFVAENKTYARHSTKNMNAMREEEVHGVLEYLVDPRNPLTEHTCQVICGLAMKKNFEDRGMPPPEPLNYPLFALFKNRNQSQQQGAQATDTYNVEALLAQSSSKEEAIEIISNGILKKLSVLLSVAADEVDPGKSIRANGVDSLIVMEFRAWLAKEVGAELPLIDIMVGGSINELGQRVASVSRFVQGNGS
ncbi:Type I Iterative PKS [Arachnomyces sp. PD_36]|nr:Type I Iterative PKS [Arachnomyces sp. PD_36]